TPVRVADLLLVSSITYGSAGLRLTTKDGKPGFEKAWTNPALTCYFSTPAAVGTSHLYMVTGTNPLAFKKSAAALQCVDVQGGKSVWTRPNVGKYHASLLRTGDDKLLMLDDGGSLVLLDPSP